MADTNPDVMDLVESELRKNPDISNPELLEMAKKIDPSVEKLTSRQFNARYPLQVKRAMAPSKPRRRKRAPKKSREAGTSRSTDSGRDNVRRLLLQLAKDVGNAEGKGDVVDVVAGIDRYVDRVLKAVAK